MKISRKNFTLFELLISTALLIIVLVVLLKVLAMTGDYWHYSNKQSDVYVDQKVLFDLLEEEFSNQIYDYSNSDDEKKIFAPLSISTFSNNAADALNINGNELKNGTMLCLVTHTRRDSEAEYSDICKVGYIYYPPVAANSNVYNNIGKNGGDDYVPRRNDGVIVRVLLDEDSPGKFTGNQTMSDYFDFDYTLAKEVISGVVKFEVQPLKFNSGSNKFETPDALDNNAGLKEVRAIKVTMTMLPDGHFDEFRNEYQEELDCQVHGGKDWCAQQDFLHKHARTFSRTYWIKP